jgi:CBS-domain-containing membrane protein
MAIPNVKCFFKPDLSSQFAELREELSIAQQRIEDLTKETELQNLIDRCFIHNLINCMNV